MKLAVATAEEMGFGGDTSLRFPGWMLFHTDFVRPSEIRARIEALIRAEDSGGTENHLVTMNRTVLDMATHPDIKCPGPMDYEDVFVWKDGRLVSLLDIHDADWLVHFRLGDVFDREAF